MIPFLVLLLLCGAVFHAWKTLSCTTAGEVGFANFVHNRIWPPVDGGECWHLAQCVFPPFSLVPAWFVSVAPLLVQRMNLVPFLCLLFGIEDEKVLLLFVVRIAIACIACACYATFIQSFWNGNPRWMILNACFGALTFSVAFLNARINESALVSAVVSLALARWLSCHYWSCGAVLTFGIVFLDVKLVVLLLVFFILSAKKTKFAVALLRNLPCFVIFSLASLAFDSLQWKEIVIPSFSFVKANILMLNQSKVNASDAFWYFTHGIPEALPILWPFAVIGLIFGGKIRLIGAIAVYLAFLSIFPQKKLELLQSLIPAVLSFSIVGLHTCTRGPFKKFTFALIGIVALALIVHSACLSFVTQKNEPLVSALKSVEKGDIFIDFHSEISLFEKPDELKITNILASSEYLATKTPHAYLNEYQVAQSFSAITLGRAKKMIRFWCRQPLEFWLDNWKRIQKESLDEEVVFLMKKK